MDYLSSGLAACRPGKHSIVMLCNVLIRIRDIQEFAEVHLHELAVSTTEWSGQREASERELSEGERDWRKTEGDVRERERER